MDWEDVDDVVDGGFLKKIRQEYIHGNENLSEELQGETRVEADAKKPRRGSSFTRSAPHPPTAVVEENKKKKRSSKSCATSRKKEDSSYNQNTTSDRKTVSKLNNESCTSDTTRKEQNNSSTGGRRRRRKNNLYVYNMHLQQNSEDTNQYAVTVVPDTFYEAKVLEDDEAFNRLAHTNFIRVEPWKWKHFPYQERFQRLVRPEAKMWIKRTTSKDVDISESATTTTNNDDNDDASSKPLSRDNNHRRYPLSAYQERKKKNTQWRKPTADWRRKTLDV